MCPPQGDGSPPGPSQAQAVPVTAERHGSESEPASGGDSESLLDADEFDAASSTSATAAAVPYGTVQ